MAIQTGLTVYDLEESELAYAPPFGSAKDPVNFAGMVAVDILRDDMPLCHWDAVEGGFLLDVREPAELTVEHVPGAVNIPLPELRACWASSPRPRDPRLLPLRPARLLRDAHLLQNGFKARNIAGGMLSRSVVPRACRGVGLGNVTQRRR